jgi:hypothetical protein
MSLPTFEELELDLPHLPPPTFDFKCRFILEGRLETPVWAKDRLISFQVDAENIKDALLTLLKPEKDKCRIDYTRSGEMPNQPFSWKLLAARFEGIKLFRSRECQFNALMKKGLHPVQTSKESLNALSRLFRLKMRDCGVLPKNPFRAKKTRAWIEKIGCRMDVIHNPSWDCPLIYRWGLTDWERFVSFEVECKSTKKISGSRSNFIRIDVPHDLADKVLLLGYLP